MLRHGVFEGFIKQTLLSSLSLGKHSLNQVALQWTGATGKIEPKDPELCYVHKTHQDTSRHIKTHLIVYSQSKYLYVHISLYNIAGKTCPWKVPPPLPAFPGAWKIQAFYESLDVTCTVVRLFQFKFEGEETTFHW